MKAARCAPALCGGKPNDLAVGIASYRLNFRAARLNGTESPPKTTDNPANAGTNRARKTLRQARKYAAILRTRTTNPKSRVGLLRMRNSKPQRNLAAAR